MTIMEQIKRDLETFKQHLEATYQPGLDIGLNDEEMELLRDEYRAEIVRLKALLYSGIVPESYTLHPLIAKNIKTIQASPGEFEQPTHFMSEVYSFFCKKRSRKRDSIPHSEFSIHYSNGDKITSFFVEHHVDHIYPNGGVASKVKQGFNVIHEKPCYAVKVFKKDLFGGNITHTRRIAMRGAFCNRLLGREGYFFEQNEKQYLITTWLTGVTLDKVQKKELLVLPVPYRILLAAKLVKQIVLLHRLGIIHGDIKPTNVMFSEVSLELFDFDSVRGENEIISGAPRIPPVTARFLDEQANFALKQNAYTFYRRLNVKSDLYALGLTLAWLFPEILRPVYVKRRGPNNLQCGLIELEPENEYNAHENLGAAILGLTAPIEERPAFAEEFYNQLAAVLSQYPAATEYTAHLEPLEEISACAEMGFNEIEMELISFNRRSELVSEQMNMTSVRYDC